MESHMLPLLHIRTLLPATSATCCLLPTCLLAIYPQLSCYLSHVFHVIRFILQEVHTEGVRPPKPICQDPIADHYMMAQGRVLSCLELWMLARGDDLRGAADCHMSVSKLYGSFVPLEVVGPDSFYKMQLLKDESKSNKTGKNEIIGGTRHKDPILCSINAVQTMLILRFGRNGCIGELPNFFDMYCRWTEECGFLTQHDGQGMLSYTSHYDIFKGMKQAAGMENILADSATKLRSFGAMNANEHQATNAEIRRTGR